MTSSVGTYTSVRCLNQCHISFFNKNDIFQKLTSNIKCFTNFYQISKQQKTNIRNHHPVTVYVERRETVSGFGSELLRCVVDGLVHPELCLEQKFQHLSEKFTHTHTEFLGAEAVDIFSKSLASCLCTWQNFCLINFKISHTVLLCFSITGNTIALGRKKKYRRVQGFTVVRFIMQKIHPLHKFRNTAQGVLMQGQCSSRLPAAAEPLHSRGANLPRGKTGKSFACFRLIG